MKVDLTPYRDKKICVALSGGKDSMALLHYLMRQGGGYGISLCAVNCDHCIRGEESRRDSLFVADYCKTHGIELYFFSAEGLNLADEKSARNWRLGCFDEIIKSGRAHFIATAHHMNDNAETVLFNIARGSSLAGAVGIRERTPRGYIRPLIGVSRGEIDEYIVDNAIPYVTDSTNLSDDYTRNKLRHGVIPLLEQAVPGAVQNIFRFSRLAAEEEEYLTRVASAYVKPCRGGFIIAPCAERVIFKRAAAIVVAGKFCKKDYTSDQFERLYTLAGAENGRKFSFLGLSAVKQSDGIAITEELKRGECPPVSFSVAAAAPQPYYYCGELFCVIYDEDERERLLLGISNLKALAFDADKIPEGAVVRFRQKGDKFTKFGGGTKSLGDYFTDKKIPQGERELLPLIAVGGDVLAVGGAEISERIKITEKTVRAAYLICVAATAK